MLDAGTSSIELPKPRLAPRFNRRTRQIGGIVETSALLFNLVKYLGAAYLVYLGIRAILERTELSAGQKSTPIDVSRAFRQAVVAEILNPRSALFFLAFLPQFVQPENGAVSLQLAVLGVLFVALGAMSTIFVAVCAGGLLHRSMRPAPTACPPGFEARRA